jgi:hypothetical protein
VCHSIHREHGQVLVIVMLLSVIVSACSPEPGGPTGQSARGLENYQASDLKGVVFRYMGMKHYLSDDEAQAFLTAIHAAKRSVVKQHHLDAKPTMILFEETVLYCEFGTYQGLASFLPDGEVAVYVHPMFAELEKTAHDGRNEPDQEVFARLVEVWKKWGRKQRAG